MRCLLFCPYPQPPFLPKTEPLPHVLTPYLKISISRFRSDFPPGLIPEFQESIAHRNRKRGGCTKSGVVPNKGDIDFYLRTWGQEFAKTSSKT
ncbi:hypothetical protein CEXT_543921 [Caerostris extrusa]|uniref:Uncharacterized protein n=1 Tax=Caerostris extrusa TaxID=172846 RepID=A0AAV4T328_CAEEX|nr:hypothetical protein CEXT_543921 [Caerostris extrusa]